MAIVNKYKILSPVDHDLTRYEIGSIIELDAVAADLLLKRPRPVIEAILEEVTPPVAPKVQAKQKAPAAPDKKK